MSSIPQVIPFQQQRDGNTFEVDLVAQRVTTVIPKGVKIIGDIEADEGVRIDGHIEGQVISKSGAVLVGKDGVIAGSLETHGQTIIEGVVNAGEAGALAVRAYETLIVSDAKICGVVEYNALEVRGDIEIIGRLRPVAK